MNHASVNTSVLLGIWMFCDSSIYGLAVTRASTFIPRADIDLYHGHGIERPCVCSLQSGNFGYLGSIWRVLLVVWASTGGVSEGVFWLAHCGDWVIEKFTLLLKWLSPPLPTFHFLGLGLLVTTLPLIWLKIVASFLCVLLGNLKFILPWVRLRLMPWVWQ